ncbi:MAG: helix-turn-helix domain-containing protein, partial [bacterium]
MLEELKHIRESKGISTENIEDKLSLGKGWVVAIEEGRVIPSFDLILAIADAARIDLSQVLNKVKPEEGKRILSRQINAEQKGSDLILGFQYGDYDAKYILRNATTSQFNELLAHFRDNRNLTEMNKTDAVVATFFKALKLWSKANPSDIWWFVVSRIFLDPYNHPASEMRR